MYGHGQLASLTSLHCKAALSHDGGLSGGGINDDKLPSGSLGVEEGMGHWATFGEGLVRLVGFGWRLIILSLVFHILRENLDKRGGSVEWQRCSPDVSQ